MASFNAFTSVAKQLSAGVKREFLSPNKVRLKLSWGFPYEAYGPNAVVRPWHILNLVESGRALSCYRSWSTEEEPFLRVEDLDTHYGLFMGSIKLNISKELYDIALPKTPLTLEKELVYVGKSSMNIHTDIVLPEKSLLLASCKVQSVLVDRQTRRPASYPGWWMEQFGQYSYPGRQLKVNVQKPPACEASNEVPGTMEKKGSSCSPIRNWDTRLHGEISQDLPISSSVTSLTMTVCDSDVDFYGHVNWSVFLRYCLDALLTGTSSETSNQLKSRAVKSAEISYIGEGTIGQQMKVSFWKDETVPGSVHFHIADCDSNQLITYAFLQFYSLNEVELRVQAKL